MSGRYGGDIKGRRRGSAQRVKAAERMIPGMDSAGVQRGLDAARNRAMRFTGANLLLLVALAAWGVLWL